MAAADLTPTDSIFILPNIRAATRNDWDLLINTDADFKQRIADIIPSGQSYSPNTHATMLSVHVA